MNRLNYLLLLLLCFQTLTLHAEGLKVSPKTPSVILMNPETGRILYEKNAHEPRFPGSTIKIATALFLLEEKHPDLDSVTTISHEAVSVLPASVKQADFNRHPSHRLEHDGTIMGIKKGEKVPLRSLMYGLMLSSGNDAANALVEHCCGSYERFIAEVNAYLKRKGFKETYLTNAHGLHHPELKTTAFEMAKLTAEAMKHPFFKQLVATLAYEVPATNLSPARTLLQHNRLMKKGALYYPKATGGKTGYHARAKYTLSAVAEDKGRKLIAVLLGAETSEQRFKEAIMLFEAAFKEKPVGRTLFAKESDLFSLIVPHAAKPLKARLLDEVNISYYPSEEPSVKAQLCWNACTLPIEAEQKVGELKVVDERGKVLVSTALYAVEHVEKKLFFRFIDGVKEQVWLWIGIALVTLAALVARLYFQARKQAA